MATVYLADDVKHYAVLGYLHWPNLAEGAVFLESLRGASDFQALFDEVKPRWEELVAWEETLQ